MTSVLTTVTPLVRTTHAAPFVNDTDFALTLVLCANPMLFFGASIKFQFDPEGLSTEIPSL